MEFQEQLPTLPVPVLILTVGRQYQSSWWMLAWRVVSTKQSQMTNNNIPYTPLLYLVYFF